MFQIFNSLGVFVSPFVFSHRILEHAQRWPHTTSADITVDVNLGFIEIIRKKKKPTKQKTDHLGKCLLTYFVVSDT